MSFGQRILSWGIWAALGIGLVLSTGGAMAQSAQDGIHLGVSTCAGSTCHGRVERFANSPIAQNEYLIWSQKDPHAKAYKALESERGKRIAQNLGLGAATSAEMCLGCHTDNAPAAKRSRQFQLSDGVGCETCHGAAEKWLGIHVAGSPHNENVAAGMYPTDQPLARAKLCLSCHVGDNSKYPTHQLMGAGHPRMPFELDTFTAIQPAHYTANADYARRKGQPNGVQVWAVGQAVALGNMMNGLLDAKRNREGAIPDFVFFECQSCHHPMTQPRWEARASTGLGPGQIMFNDANALMLRIAAQRVAPALAQQLFDRTVAMHQGMNDSRAKVLEEAAKLRDIANQLATAFAGRRFGPEDLTALLEGVIDAGVNRNDFTNYGGAEQATMALSAIITTMRNVGQIDSAKFQTAQAALNKVYATVEKDDAFKPSTFVAALKDFQTAMPK